MTAIESTESSSPIVTRAIAAGLRGTFCDNFPLPGWQKAVLLALGGLPPHVGRAVVSRFQTFSGLPASALDDFHISDLLSTRLRDYAQLDGKFPVITAGASLGGAAAHLSLALGGPFLPQAFVLTLQGGSPNGDVLTYLSRSQEIAQRITRHTSGVMTIQHFDPIHDGWLTRYVNHLRLKLVDIPSAYHDFILKHLHPEGTLVFFDCGAQWKRYRLSRHSIFQIGGWGDISADEYLEGSDRIRAYARQAGLSTTDWKLDDFRLEEGPESEWGTEPGLAESLDEFCRRKGLNFVRIRLPEPHDFSRLAFAAQQKLLEKEGREPQGVLVETFTQFDASAARQAGLLPLWLIFNTQDSLNFFNSMRPQFPEGKPVFFSPLSTFSVTPDMVSWDQWEAALAGLDWTNIGARAGHYPSDTRAIVRWADPLRKWVRANRKPVTSTLTPHELAELARRLQKK
jgi:hypothetical protein